MLKTTTIQEVKTKLKAYNNGRSAWSKGVKDYAFELLENYKEYEGEHIANLKALNNGQTGDYHIAKNHIESVLLSGASDWTKYSYGGFSLIYNEDIAKRLSSPSELKNNRNGEREPNAWEKWLDTQARALYQAFRLIIRILNS